ncbi:MAG: Lpg1974 family pore-forming outer membrane protein [Candidatus Dependentiae bacterium]|nr:Lpg1974 family pore-forming outer membrane protein [Candidatus Dependentiae bacterium]
MQNKKLLLVAAFFAPVATMFGGRCCEIKKGCTDPLHVLASSPAHRFEVYGSALALKPSTSNLHYAIETTQPSENATCRKVDEIHPSYHFGFDLGFKTIFHNEHTNLMVNYEHINARSSSKGHVSGEDYVSPIFQSGYNDSDFKKAHASVRFHFDEVNLDYGQLLSIGNHVCANIFGGVSFMRLKQNLCHVFTSEDQSIERSTSIATRFIGAGPQGGIEARYCLYKGLTLEGKGVSALLIGRMKDAAEYEREVSEVETTQNIKVCARTQVVPAFLGKLGLSYEFEFCSDYVGRVAVGYQAQEYLNAIQSVEISDEPIAIASGFMRRQGPSNVAFQRTLSNFALSGAYVTLEVGF